MATIRYTFADGHTEEVEVTEEFKREYEFLLVREQAPHWKEMKQTERAGLRCVKNLSLCTVRARAARVRCTTTGASIGAMCISKLK